MSEDKIIDKIVKDLNKKYEGKVKTLEEKQEEGNVLGFIPTGNLALDYVIGRRGIPVGRVTEIYGKSGSAKSSTIASIIGSAQSAGHPCALIDAENSYDPSWARRFNVDTESLILTEPETLEESFDQTRDIIHGLRDCELEAPALVVYDSVSAIPTKAELEQEDSSASRQSAEHATIISREMRKITQVLKNQKISLLFVSQLKDNPRASWGNTDSIIGGSAIKFHAGLRIKLTHMSYISVKDQKIGINVQAQATKNKFTLPFKTWTFPLYYERGFDKKEILLDFLCSDMVKAQKPPKQGWYEFDGEKLRLEDVLPKLDDSLFELVYEKLGIPA